MYYSECNVYRFSFAVLDCSVAATFTIWCQTPVKNWVRITDGRALFVDVLGFHVVVSDRDTAIVEHSGDDD